MIAGRTHPDIAHREGERYRLTLEQAVLDLGLEDHVEFDDRFLSVEEIADLLADDRRLRDPVPGARADLVGGAHVRPRRRLRRRLDPVLVRAGHARHRCRHDRAVRRSRRARRRRLPLHRASRRQLAAARAEARRIGAQLAWPSVAEATAAVLQEAVELAPRRRRSVSGIDQRLVSMRTDHLLTLVDDVGIVQHADGVIPNRESGYCVDDVARLAVVALELARRGDEQVWTSILYRSLAFLQDATDPAPACATSWATTAAGSTSPIWATTSAARSGHSARSSRRHGCPPSSAPPSGCSTRSSIRSRRRCRYARAPTRRSASRASTRTGAARGPGSCWSA